MQKIFAINIGILFLFLEISTLIIYKTKPYLLFSGHIDPKAVKCSSGNNSSCDHERFHKKLGWNTADEDPYGDGIREASISKKQNISCGAAFGDSFTYSEDVSADQAWTTKLSELLGCEILNFGVGGYSYVQSFEKFKYYKPNEELIIFLVYGEMLKRSLSSSNYFLGGKGSDIYPRPFLGKNGEVINIPTPLNNNTLSNHIYLDWNSESPELIFPFFYNWLLHYGNLSNRKRYPYNHSQYFNTWEMRDTNNTHDFFKQFHLYSLERFNEMKNKKILLAFLPASVYLERHSSIEKRISEVSYPENVCVANPAKSIIQLNQKGEDLLGPSGHLNAIGDRFLSIALKKRIDECWN